MQAKTITINIRKKLIRLHRNRRRKRISGIVREEAARLTKADPGSISISRQLNEALLKGAQGPSFMLARVTVSVEKKGDGVELRIPVSAAAPAATTGAAQKTDPKKQIAQKQGTAPEEQAKK